MSSKIPRYKMGDNQDILLNQANKDEAIKLISNKLEEVFRD